MITNQLLDILGEVGRNENRDKSKKFKARSAHIKPRLIDTLEKEGVRTVLIDDEKLYLPLLLDYEGFREYKRKTGPIKIDFIENVIRRINGLDKIKTSEDKKYIETISLVDLIASIEKIEPVFYNYLREAVIKNLFKHMKVVVNPESLEIAPELFYTLIFEVSPVFVKYPKKLIGETRSLEDRIFIGLEEVFGYKPSEESIAKIKEMLNIEEEIDIDSVKNLVENHGVEIKDGVYSIDEFREMIMKALTFHVLKTYINDLEVKMQELKNVREENIKRLALLYELANKKEIVLGDFGIIKRNDGSYIVYKETGEYALEDFDGEVYKFPSAKVGVIIYKNGSVSRPLVVNKYKHPFLSSVGSMQEICIRESYTITGSLAEEIITKINIGIATLLHGYFEGMDHPGYHKLDGTKHSSLVPPLKFTEFHVKDSKKLKVPITNHGIRR